MFRRQRRATLIYLHRFCHHQSWKWRKAVCVSKWHFLKGPASHIRNCTHDALILSRLPPFLLYNTSQRKKENTHYEFREKYAGTRKVLHFSAPLFWTSFGYTLKKEEHGIRRCLAVSVRSACCKYALYFLETTLRRRDNQNPPSLLFHVPTW